MCVVKALAFANFSIHSLYFHKYLSNNYCVLSLARGGPGADPGPALL